MSKNKPIAVFDSGVGGLTVFKAVSRLLPKENLLYFADNHRIPYGDKSPEDILRYTRESAHFLMDKGIKMLILACHTASAHCLPFLQDELKIPVIGVIESSLRLLKKIKTFHSLAVLGTRGTIDSGIYQKRILEKFPYANIFPVSCPLLAPSIEKSFPTHQGIEGIIASSLAPIEGKKIDTVLLACTHFPLIQPQIQNVLGKEVFVIESAEETAIEIKTILEEKNLVNDKAAAQYQFFASRDMEEFGRKAENFLELNYF